MDRKTTGQKVDSADCLGVDDREDALEILEVERLIKLETVEDNQQLVLLTAADVDLGSDVAPGRARKAFDRPVEIIGGVRHLTDLLPVQELPMFGLLLEKPEVARGHDDLVEENRYWNEVESKP